MRTRPYVVKPGNYLMQLAFCRGFVAQTVWNSSENEELRRQRDNPEMLLPGDVLHIPDSPTNRSELRAASQNRFKARVSVAETIIRLTDSQGHALAREPYRIEGVGVPIEGMSDANGNVRIRIPVTRHEVRLILPRRRAAMSVLLGHLDPIDSETGICQRLESLGYLGQLPNPDEILDAIRRFQHDMGLPPTGRMNNETRERLREHHAS